VSLYAPYQVAEVDDVDEVWTASMNDKGFKAYVKERTDEWLEEEMGQLALDYYDECGKLVSGVGMHEYMKEVE
jgi:hypothetical protein